MPTFIDRQPNAVFDFLSVDLDAFLDSPGKARTGFSKDSAPLSQVSLQSNRLAHAPPE